MAGHKPFPGDLPQAMMLQDLKLYAERWPFINDFLRADESVTKMFTKSGMVDGYRIALDKIPETLGGAEKRDIVRAGVEFLEDYLRGYQFMTALANHLAVHRRRLERNGLPVPLAVLRVRPATAWEQSEGSRSPGNGLKDMPHQARAYAFELKWVRSVVIQWTEDQKKYREYRGWLNSWGKDLDIASRYGKTEWVSLKSLAGLLPSDDDSATALVKAYIEHFRTFAKEWDRLLIRYQPDRPAETCLAYTEAHLKLFTDALQKATALLKLSSDLESLLKQIAKAKLLRQDQAVILWMKSFDEDDHWMYRKVLQESLEPHSPHLFDMTTMPQLLQRWQTDKLEKAVLGLKYLEKDMSSWLEDHDDDPLDQGIHLRPETEREDRRLEVSHEQMKKWNDRWVNQPV